MKPMPKAYRLHRALLAWYAQVGRDLPWRRTRDPYAIAVSEVMLQQTQVDRVIPKFLAWRRAWPTTKSLARAPLSEVLKLWSGLGYNSRAMRLRAAARVVMTKFYGRWPRTVEELQSLPGFGPYTAGAVATFAFQQRVPVMDTNIRRVISRIFFGVRGPANEKVLMKKVADALPAKNPDLWNHALMDLGATICVARKPKCEICPLKTMCRAYPAILSVPYATKTKLTPKFETTDRYWRGRIVAVLAQSGQLTLVALKKTISKHRPLDEARYYSLLEDLERAGLLTRRRRTISISD